VTRPAECDTRCYTRRMPSAHRRVGLVVDDPVAAALGVLNRSAHEPTAEASLARRAVIEGAALDAVIQAARLGGSPDATLALVALQQALAGLDDDLYEDVTAQVLREIGQALADAGVAARRTRQRALLSSDGPPSEVALELKERLDSHEPLLNA
jgi:hypothetical protein